MSKITTIVGISFAIYFLVGLATTLTKSMMNCLMFLNFKEVWCWDML